MNLDENTFARLIEQAGADAAPRPQHQQELRKQALAAFDLAQAKPARRAFLPTSLADWRWIMRSPVSRIAATVIFVAALGGVGLWLHGGGATYALADFTKPLLAAKKMRYKETVSGVMHTPDRQSPFTVTAKILVLDSKHLRRESLGPDKSVSIWDGEKKESLAIYPTKMKAYFYRLDEMDWTKTPPGNFSPVFNLKTILRETENKPELKREPLGEKEIQGKRVTGYRITYHEDLWELWGDPKTGLPVLVELTQHQIKRTWSDFEFNVDLDESLFSTVAPSPYKMVEMDVLPGTENDVIDTLRAYSEIFNGVFPDSLGLEATNGAINRAFTEHKSSQFSPPREDRYSEVGTLFMRCHLFVQELPPSSNARYAGRGVKYGAPHKPIFWYRPKDSKSYVVVYADLSVKEAKTPPQAANARRVPDPKSFKIPIRARH
jgi:outer membrane lipoprotein-sorting protein